MKGHCDVGCPVALQVVKSSGVGDEGFGVIGTVSLHVLVCLTYLC